MSQQHTKEDILSVISEIDCAAVSTVSGVDVRSRMMHYWNNEDFDIYVATIKGDPKTLQITQNPSVSLLITRRKGDINDSVEVEVTGRAVFVRDEQEKKMAFDALATKSPVVKYLKDTNNLGMLDCVKIVPIRVKYRVFKEIVQGLPPTVLEFPENKTVVNEFGQLKRKLKNWSIELRSSFLTATIVSILLGTSIAWVRNVVFDLEYFLLALIGAIFLHLGTNVINDYFDYRSGNDEVNTEFVRPFSGGSRTIQLGLLTPLEVLSGALLFYLVGLGIGLYLTWTRGPVILILGLIGFISGFFYTAPPFNFAGRGIGEALVGINFGVLMTLGAYFVQTQTFTVEPLIASVPVALLIAAVLYINEFPDYKADKTVGKATLVVRLGRKRAALGYAALMIGVHGFILAGVLVGALPFPALISFTTLPFTIKAIQYAFKWHSSSFDLVPANAFTVVSHLSTSLLLSLGYIIERMGAQIPIFILITSLVFLIFTAYTYSHIERQKNVLLELKNVFDKT